MGDHRLTVDIQLVGMEGESKKIDWWLNWTPDKPQDLYCELVRIAREVGLEVNDKSYLFDE